MTARSTDHVNNPPFREPPTRALPTDNDTRSEPAMAGRALPLGHPDRVDAAAIRRESWRRRPNVRTSFLRQRRSFVEVRP